MPERDWPLEVPVTKKLVALLQKAGYWARYNRAEPNASGGLPDILLVDHEGRAHWYELKAPGKRPTARQVCIHTQIHERTGTPVRILEIPRTGETKVMDAARDLACTINAEIELELD